MLVPSLARTVTAAIVALVPPLAIAVAAAVVALATHVLPLAIAVVASGEVAVVLATVAAEDIPAAVVGVEHDFAPLDEGQGITVRVIADADREQDAVLRGALDGDGRGEARAIRWEDGHEAVVRALMVGGTGVVVSENGRGGFGLAFGEVALEGGDVSAV